MWASSWSGSLWNVSARDSGPALLRPPKPFTWTKTADEILKSLADYYKVTSVLRLKW
ncbi:hypothetical protein ABT126_40080 [Streptomyces sp. NPDC002012]|uniref:hypothetical protein n=1 Tax=Streptomyces sp. NPDC002012 TaxID=3154532 RepID=UPI00332F51F9